MVIIVKELTATEESIFLISEQDVHHIKLIRVRVKNFSLFQSLPPMAGSTVGHTIFLPVGILCSLLGILLFVP